ncbi:ImmA/IrrE family metallo-endopeptidase [Aeribacillus composti]|uniref:ImmA/IrrE family metallo-endopeptidase n=1 Tax=Aeribacillus composti TaxID=1868734 RepID=A0ABY9WCD8_9BACI|nr:ImmA/IrrE family metallo-endopeptidase [Aeribacillus composti]WNF33799.1 ImmA/IrrE family metallo-endopeptidase [Aeribacillus composti]
MTYENLLREAQQHGIDTYEKPMTPTIKGLYSDKVIWINKNIPTNDEKACILAEELGHYHTSSGNILDQSKISNRKQELRARTWAYERLVPLQKIVQAHKSGVRNRYELAEYLGVTEDFLNSAIKRYQEKYGLCVSVESYTVCFEPLGVLEMFE